MFPEQLILVNPIAGNGFLMNRLHPLEVWGVLKGGNRKDLTLQVVEHTVGGT